mgnify:CR=1 FL=1
MNVTNCRTCGRLFNQLTNEKICPACKQDLEDSFQKVKAYLEEYPNSTVEQVATDNEVSMKQIKQWVREERLVFSEGSLQGVECENCGVMIRTGRYCEECKLKIKGNLMSALDKPKDTTVRRQERERDRMRFL